jgi:hypothetical protein
LATIELRNIRLSQYEDVEAQGILVNSEFKVVTTLDEKKAYSQKSATQVLELEALLDILQKSGVIKKTQDGKYYITKKGRQKQYKGFKIARK